MISMQILMSNKEKETLPVALDVSSTVIYFWLKCETIYSRVHMKKPYYLRSVQGVHSFLSLSSLSGLLDQQIRLSSNVKNHMSHKKLPHKTNVSKTYRKMGDSLRPTLTHVSYGGQYQISATDENQTSSDQVRMAPGNDNQGECAGTKSTRKCSVPPGFRVWESVNRSNKNNGSSVKFKIVSYNLLAQYLLDCHPYLYTECSPFDLKWNVRAERLYNEIVNLNPDILCLQEVQVSHLKTFFERFNRIGYYSVFKQKTGDRNDGCAIYFKSAVFELLDHASVEFYQPEIPILNRDNVGVMVKLVPKSSPESPFVVATTHLLYNPNRTDVRLAQIKLFLAEIDRFSYYVNSKESGHLPVVLTGDFNSKPDSAVVRLLDYGQVSAEVFRDHSDWRRIGITDNCQHLSVYINRMKGDGLSSNILIQNTDYPSNSTDNRSPGIVNDYNQFFNTGSVGYSLNLTSVYDRIKKNGSFEATTFQNYWVTVDYIYFSRHSNMCLLERLRLPTMSECEVLSCLPNEVYASDHLALGAVFEIKPPKCSL